MIYLLAFLGGMILNLMPCVLPVLALKAMSMQRRSWQYVAGIMTVFLVLGVLATFPGFMWGSHFDNLWFTYTLAAIVFVMGLSYLDAWHLPYFGLREAQSDFGKGVLTTVLSSACSGPFLGAVFAATLTEPAWKIVTLFLVIGAGLSTPYLLFPRSWIPKPGAWMVTLKKIAGMTMIVTSFWLFDTRLLALGLVLLVAWAGWHGGQRLALITAMGVCLLMVCVPVLPQTDISDTYNEADHRFWMNHNQIVLVEFTGNMCITCKINHEILNSHEVVQLIQKYDVKFMKATMPNGRSVLKWLGYSSVPVVAVFPGLHEPIVLTDVVTKRQVIKSLEIANELTTNKR
jgi:thiol:disulfide interchange protein